MEFPLFLDTTSLGRKGNSITILRSRLYEKNKFIGFINMCVSVNELSCCVLSK